VRFRTFAFIAATVIATAARAQTAPVPIPYLTYVALNPLGIPFDIVSAEFETAVASGVTVGALGSYTVIDSDRYGTVDAKVRYYPGEVVLSGFSLGMSLGRTHYSTPVSTPTGTDRAALDFATLGLLVDYNWLLGTRHRFVVGTGIGAKRVLASAGDRDRVNIERAYVTGRFVVGLAF